MPLVVNTSFPWCTAAEVANVGPKLQIQVTAIKDFAGKDVALGF